MGVQDGDDLRSLRLGDGDVLIDQIGMGLDHGEGAVGLAAEDVGGAGRVVIEQLAEEHRTPWSFGRLGLDKLSSDLLNIKRVASPKTKNALFEAIAVMGK